MKEVESVIAILNGLCLFYKSFDFFKMYNY